MTKCGITPDWSQAD